MDEFFDTSGEVSVFELCIVVERAFKREELLKLQKGNMFFNPHLNIPSLCLGLCLHQRLECPQHCLQQGHRLVTQALSFRCFCARIRHKDQ